MNKRIFVNESSEFFKNETFIEYHLISTKQFIFSAVESVINPYCTNI